MVATVLVERIENPRRKQRGTQGASATGALRGRLHAALPLEGATLAPQIEQRVLLMRGHKVMLSTSLAELYEVEPKVLMQAVKRNRERFPDDFMFQLDSQEVAILKSQFVTSSWGGARRARPHAFTEQGIAMLSSVLRSPRAIVVNIEIMRSFVRLRQLIASHADLAAKLTQLEKKYDAQFRVVFDAMRKLMEPVPALSKRRIGF